jgi:hypothetical protein
VQVFVGTAGNDTSKNQMNEVYNVQTHTETTPTPNNQLNTSTTTTTNKLATLKPVSTSITLMLAKRDGMPVGNSNGQ